MARGLIKLTAIANNIEAWRDWRKLAEQYPDLAAKFAPQPSDGWRKVDKCIAKLRKEVEELQ